METHSLMTKPLVFITTENGCYIPISHRLNHDGYFRKRVKGDLEMFHRFIWKAYHGDIPKDFEINHLCGNRSCQNVKHLECIHGKEHAIKTNKERYSDINAEAKHLWETGKFSAASLANKYGWRAYKWVRRWKNVV